MQIREIENKEEWDNFVMKQPFYTFMNSWDWGEFNKRMGCKPPHQNFWHGCKPPHQNFWCGGKIFRLGFYDGERLAGLALFIKVEARRGTHLFCPYGPVFDGSDYIEQLPNVQCVILSKAKDPIVKQKNNGILRRFTPQNDAKTPFGDNPYIQKLAEIMPEVVKLAKQEKACFIRISPLIKNSLDNLTCRNLNIFRNSDHHPERWMRGKNLVAREMECGRCISNGILRHAERGLRMTRFFSPMRRRLNLDEFKNLGFKFAPMHVHAEDNWLLDITKPEDELLKNMRKTTRYLIKRAIKEGVKVEKNNSEEYIDKFIKMHRNHASRDKGGYTAFSEDYIKNLFKVFPENDINLMYAEYKPSHQNFWRDDEPHRRDGACPVSTKDNIEAMLVSIKYGKTTAYYLGASDIRHPKFSPAYLLQWESIKKARDAGCEIYNFWGVAPDDNPKHPLAGVSLFKKGFGGYSFNLAHAQDMPLTWKYWINWGVETVRRMKRGYYYKF